MAPSSGPHWPPVDPITREWYCPQARIAGRLTFQPVARFRPSGGFHQHRPGVWRVCHIPGRKSRSSFKNLNMHDSTFELLLGQFLPQFFGLLRPKSGNAARGGADLYETAAPGWERGTLGSYRSALGLRWDGSAGYWIRRGVGRPARSRRAQCWTADRVCTAFSLRNDPPEESRSPRVARARGELGDGVSFKPSVEESEQPASTSRHASFGERFLFDLASFDERFAGGDISVAETEDSDSNVLNYAHLPSLGPGEYSSQSVTGRSTPKLAPTALSPPASPARKRVATAEASKHSITELAATRSTIALRRRRPKRRRHRLRRACAQLAPGIGRVVRAEAERKTVGDGVGLGVAGRVEALPLDRGVRRDAAVGHPEAIAPAFFPARPKGPMIFQ